MPERKLPGNIIFNPWLLLRQLRYNIYPRASEHCNVIGSVRGRIVIGRAKRAPHWDVQSKFRVIYKTYYTGQRGI